jgi:intracellular sulfur oxidation DsrE/DsrF family protein
MKSRNAFLSLAAVAALSTTAFAAQPPGFWSFPAIQGYGPVHVWPQAVDRPSSMKTYKALFDVTQGKAASDKVNPGLDHIARTVNIFAAAGVPLSHLKFDVIIHGGVTPIALSEAAYRAKFGHSNPNLRVISELRRAGVKIMVCGNALGDMGFKPAEVNPNIKVALSALSTLVIQQDQGYALMRM